MRSNELPTLRARDAGMGFADAVSRVQYAGARIALTRRGRIVAGLVSPADLERLVQFDAGARRSPAELLELVAATQSTKAVEEGID